MHLPRIKEGFPPIEGESSHTLILGTGPSEKSLLKQQYYGHERNAFWPIMQDLFNTKCETYEEKWLLLLEHDIALWDVLANFRREGSLDSAYKEVIPNDLIPPLCARIARTASLISGTSIPKPRSRRNSSLWIGRPAFL